MFIGGLAWYWGLAQTSASVLLSAARQSVPLQRARSVGQEQASGPRWVLFAWAVAPPSLAVLLAVALWWGLLHLPKLLQGRRSTVAHRWQPQCQPQQLRQLLCLVVLHLPQHSRAHWLAPSTSAAVWPAVAPPELPQHQTVRRPAQELQPAD